MFFKGGWSPAHTHTHSRGTSDLSRVRACVCAEEARVVLSQTAHQEIWGATRRRERPFSTHTRTETHTHTHPVRVCVCAHGAWLAGSGSLAPLDLREVLLSQGWGCWICLDSAAGLPSRPPPPCPPPVTRPQTEREREREKEAGTSRVRGNDPSAGSPTETLLRLHLPLDGKI